MDEKYENYELTIILQDEDGEEAPYYILDVEEYKGEQYIVLLPVEENSENGDEVVIMKREGEVPEDEEDEVAFVTEDDDPVLEAVYSIFREKFRDEFNFED